MGSPIISGVIDRISGSGNGILRVDNTEFNLGPLPHTAVGNSVVAVPLSGTWAVCLTPYTEKDEYLSEFLETTGKNLNEVMEAFANTEGPINKYFQTDLPNQFPEDLVVGLTLDVKIVVSDSAVSYVIFNEGNVIEVDVPFLPPGYETTIEITDSTSLIPTGVVAESIIEDGPDSGTEITVDIMGKKGSTAYAIHESVPVVLPECAATVGDQVHVQVVSEETGSIRAEVAALSEDNRLALGDSLEVKLDISPANKKIARIIEDLPVLITPPALPIHGEVPLVVTDVKPNTVIAEIDFTAWNGVKFEIGQILTLKDFNWYENRLIGEHDGVQFTISVSEKPPTVPKALDVVITDISPSEISTSIEPHPRLESLDEEDLITLSIDEKQEGYLLGEHRRFPVWIPFDGEIVPSELSVTITQITNHGIFASLATLPDRALPGQGEIVPAKVEDEDLATATAFLKTSGETDPYAVPVIFPITTDVKGEVGVEIVAEDDPYLLGVLRLTGGGADTKLVPNYLSETQRAIIAVRNRLLGKAVSAWTAAAKETNNELREVEARRAAAYGKAEMALNDGQYETAESNIKDFKSYLSNTNILEKYHHNLDLELDVYTQLITATRRRAPDSATGLQRIAYNISSRTQINQAAAKIPITSWDQDPDWNMVFPHPFVVDRMSQLCEKFDSIPDAAKNILTNVATLEEMQWSVPPASEAEPQPTGSLDKPSIPLELSEVSEQNSQSRGQQDNEEETSSPPNKERNSEKVSSSEPNNRNSLEHDSEASTVTTTGTVENNKLSETTDANSSESDGTVSVRGSNSTMGPIDELVVEKESPKTSRVSNELRSLRRKAEQAASTDPTRDTSQTGGGSRYQRAQPIKEFVKTRADGMCEACGEAAPFENRAGEPYLEVHHIDELGKGGEDHPSKVVALCPTCHKRIHHGQKGGKINEELRDKLQNGLAEVGTK
ncbi:HNH endonuclease [Haladaptatus caseinilyticus]|uniref:HNH endonuclease n=1 Tax=Haladaptatus caseinilyticus TaxID=2993314 RepID=UPI00224B03E3|nr:HNH endonuclease signature motif containing protein [Haladaptatus caseinilyticus]